MRVIILSLSYVVNKFLVTKNPLKERERERESSVGCVVLWLEVPISPGDYRRREWIFRTSYDGQMAKRRTENVSESNIVLKLTI
jgi:hypothetical protein